MASVRGITLEVIGVPEINARIPTLEIRITEAAGLLNDLANLPVPSSRSPLGTGIAQPAREPRGNFRDWSIGD
jgi:hypothetical protein